TIAPVIDAVEPASVAAEAGIEPGDRIQVVDGFAVRGFEDFQRLVATAPDRPVSIVLERRGDQQTIVLTPESATSTDRFGNVHRVGRIGVSKDIGPEDITVYRPGPVEAVGMTFEEIRF